MRTVIYSMGVSLDGYIAGPDGEIDWSAPDEELHRFHNEQTAELDAQLMGRGLYEAMRVWETAGEDPGRPAHEREFARIWKALSKVVVSTTLQTVEGTARLASGDVAEEVARLKREPGTWAAVGGAGLAAELIRLDRIDEYRQFVYPVALGGGTPYYPAQIRRLELELLETRRFAGVVYLRYQRRR